MVRGAEGSSSARPAALREPGRGQQARRHPAGSGGQSLAPTKSDIVTFSRPARKDQKNSQSSFSLSSSCPTPEAAAASSVEEGAGRVGGERGRRRKEPRPLRLRARRPSDGEPRVGSGAGARSSPGGAGNEAPGVEQGALPGRGPARRDSEPRSPGGLHA